MAIEVTMKPYQQLKMYALQCHQIASELPRYYWNSKERLYEIGNIIPVGISECSCNNRNVKKVLMNKRIGAFCCLVQYYQSIKKE
jgi:hypothetical protein